jgi:multiple sugar transport system permease protein
MPELSEQEVAFSAKRDLARNVLPPERVGAILLFPTLFVLVVLAIYPTFYAVWQSLRIELIYNPAASRFVGLETFANLFADPFAVKSLWLTAVWSGLVLLVQIPLGIAIALLLDRETQGASLLRTLIILPVFVSPIAMGLTWRFIFEPVSGLANWALRAVGLAPSLWLSSPDTALLSVLIADSWQWVPFVTLIVLAGIQSISTEIIEAARLDGLQGIAFVRRMVLPLIWPVLIVVILIRAVDSIRVFDLFYIMTRGGPGSSTLVSSVYGFTMFQTGRLSDMAALGITLLVAINIVATVALRLLTWSQRSAAVAS